MTLLLWDQHTCPPLQPEAEVNLLTRFAGIARLHRTASAVSAPACSAAVMPAMTSLFGV